MEKILIVLSTFLLVRGDIPLLESENQIEQAMINCIEHIASKYFSPDDSVAVLTTSVWEDFIRVRGHVIAHPQFEEKLTRTLSKWTHLTYGPLKTWKSDLIPVHDYVEPASLPSNIIIILDADSNYYARVLVQHMLSRIRKDALNSNAKTIIVSLRTMTPQENYKFASDVTWYSWYICSITKVIALVYASTPKGSADLEINVFKWFFNKERPLCLDSVENVKLTDSWMSREKSFLHDNYLFLPEEEIKDMSGCILMAEPYYYLPFLMFSESKGNPIGIDPMLIDEISKRLNFKVRYFLGEDRSLLGSRRIFINLPIVMSTYQRNFYSDSSYPHIRGRIIWAVPNGRTVPRWLSIVLIFHPYVWLFFIVTNISCSLMLWFFVRTSNELNRDLKNDTGYSSVLINILANLLGSGMSGTVRGISFSLFFVFWLFYCLHMCTAYQSLLISYLTGSHNYPPLKTLEELDNSNLTLLTPLILPDGEEDRAYGRKYRRPIIGAAPSSNFLKAMDLVAYDRSHAILAPELFLQVTRRRYYMSDREFLYTYLEEDAFITMISIEFMRGFPALNRINMLILRLQDGGFINHWHEGFVHPLMDNAEKDILEGDPVVMTLSHYQGPFFLLILGCGAAIVLFLVEVIFGRMKGKV